MGSVASSYRVADHLVVKELCIPIFVCVCVCECVCVNVCVCVCVKSKRSTISSQKALKMVQK